MSRSRIPVLALCAVLVASLSGCPPTQPNSNPITGAWIMGVSLSCNNVLDGHFVLLLHSDGSAEMYAGDLVSGAWSLDGYALRLELMAPDSVRGAATLAIDGATITNGTFMGNISGCWTAERFSF